MKEQNRHIKGIRLEALKALRAIGVRARGLLTESYGGLRALPVALLLFIASCAIEPPLRLPSWWDIEVKVGEVVTNIDVVWDIEADWRQYWWYGWDENDVEMWGEIAYPEPSTYEGRFYFYGEDPLIDFWTNVDKQTLYESSFRRSFDFGYHDMLLWSNIDSKDGTQVLVVDENDEANIFATTSRSRLSYKPAQSRGTDVYHNPEIFYSGSLNRFFISRDTADYDYYDKERKAWVMKFETQLNPVVYIYLVQVVLYNNNKRIEGLYDEAAINNVADGVNINTGYTSNRPVNVSYPMRMKNGLKARGGAVADILGSKFTTFGLCDMPPWQLSRAPGYQGSRSELVNQISVPLHFSNQTDSVYYYEITEQMQKQAHGGVITIEIDVDTLKRPTTGAVQTPSLFDPTIEPQDTVEISFEM